MTILTVMKFILQTTFFRAFFLNLWIIQNHLIKIGTIIPGLLVSKSVFPICYPKSRSTQPKQMEDCVIILDSETNKNIKVGKGHLCSFDLIPSPIYDSFENV